MSIIDTHAHIYPDAVALKAAASISEFYDIPICENGTLGALLERGDKAGISRFLVHSVAVTWKRVLSVNDYLMRAVSLHPERLIGFGTMHPDYPDVRGELQRIKAGGLKGVKLHPDFQRFLLDGPKAVALFEEMADLSMPLLTHTGDPRYPFSEPGRMARALDAVPTLKVICAHLGGWSVWEDGWKALAHRPGVWVDTSSSLYALSPEQAVELIHRYAPGHVFFGSDYPMWDPGAEVERFLKLPLAESEQEDILHRNFERFLSELL